MDITHTYNHFLKKENVKNDFVQFKSHTKGRENSKMLTKEQYKFEHIKTLDIFDIK